MAERHDPNQLVGAAPDVAPLAQLLRAELARLDLVERGPPRKIREHEVRRVDARRRAELQHVPVVRKQADRLVGPARQQRFEVRHHGGRRGLDGAHAGRQALLRIGLVPSRQLFDRLGHERHAAQVEQLQRAVGLVHLVARVAQAVEVLLVRDERLQSVDRFAQRRTDFVDDPRQRRDVGRGADQLVRVVSLDHVS